MDALAPGFIAIVAPVSGRVVGLDQLPDPVFRDRMLGDGIAIDPEEGRAVSPIAGEVAALFPTGHAVAVRTEAGLETLVHLGIDSVHLAAVFTALAVQGQQVAAGEPLVQFDLERLRREARSPLTPVVVTGLPEGWAVQRTAADRVVAGKDVVLFVVPAGAAVVEETVRVALAEGLHARPAAQLVAMAGKFRGRVTLIYQEQEVDARSVIGVLGLGARHGDDVVVRVEGPEAAGVLAAVVALIGGHS